MSLSAIVFYQITMLLDKRYSQQAAVEEYRAAMQEAQSWFEAMSRALESLDSGSGMTVDKKVAKVAEIQSDYDGGAGPKLEAVREKAEAAAREVGEMDRQNVQEQQRSVERRMAELRKRVERRRQLVEAAHAGYAETKREIERDGVLEDD